MKSLFMNLSLARKQIIILLFAGLTPMIIAAILAGKIAEAELQKQSYGQLESIREIKAAAIQRYFLNIQGQLLDKAESVETISAMQSFRKSFQTLAKQEGFSTSDSLAKIKQELGSYYTEQFLPEYKNRNNGNIIDVVPMIDKLPPSAIVAQYQYIQDNNNALGEKHLLDRYAGKSDYHNMHQRFHNGFRSFLERFGFYDIFLIEPENGVIVYSVFKELDYATSLISGPYANTNFAEAFREATQLKAGEFILKDFLPYRPSYDAPASFIASPIYSNGELEGVLVFQMPLEVVNEIMTQRDGMGESGESYLVGADLLMRSDSYLDPKNHNVSSSFSNPELGSVKTDATARAFKGETAADIIIDYNNNPVLSAFTAIDIGSGVTWAVLAEIDQVEAFAGVKKLNNQLMVIASIGTVLIIIFALVISRVLSSPILKLANCIEAVQENGDFSLSIDNQYKDEIGNTSKALNRLLSNLSTSINDTNHILDNVAQGNFKEKITNLYPGKLGVLAAGVNNAVDAIALAHEEQAKQANIAQTNAEQAKESAEKAQEQARESLVIKQALDNSSNNTIIANTKNSIVYRNNAMSNFEKNSRIAFDSVWQLILKEKSVHNEFYKKEIHYDNVTLGISITPIFDEGNAYIGSIVECLDRTEEVSVEREIDSIIVAASGGDFSKKLTCENKEGFFLNISQSLNNLLATTNIALEDIKRVFSALAGGDLSQRIERDYSGDFAKLKMDANNTIDKLREVIGNINQSAQSMSQGAQEISMGNSDLSTRTDNQASTLENTAASMEEMTKIVRSNEDSAKQADELASRTSDNAQQGNQSVQKTISAMNEITQASTKIANIISVIDEIAFQTNLLALNAAVEAARAGEQGRGFAVVAGEVRTLAQRSAEAAKEIKDLINDSVAKVNDGSALVETSGETLKSIVEEIEQVSHMIQTIATSAREQTTGIEQVNSAVLQMDQMTQQNASLVKHASAASQSMSEQAQEMNRLLSFFSHK